MGTTKIEWCDWTWNPVWGCLRGCPYCYARGIAKRFAAEIHRQNPTARLYDLNHFKPTLIQSRLNALPPKNARRVFVNSMSDIQYWDGSWLSQVLKRIDGDRLRDYLFLTKEPDIYRSDKFPPHRNILRGVTDTGAGMHAGLVSSVVDFVSAEPMMSHIRLDKYPRLRWLILGAETGNRKGKVIPEKWWMLDTLEQAADRGVPVFMKNSLRKYCEAWSLLFRQDSYL